MHFPTHLLPGLPANVDAAKVRRVASAIVKIAAAGGFAAAAAGCDNRDPLPQSRAGSGSYASDSVRLPVDPSTHLVLVKVDRPVSPTIVQFAGGQGAGIGRDDALVNGNLQQQSRKFNVTGQLMSYTTLGAETGLTVPIAQVGAHIALEATDRKITMLGPGHQVLLKCQANLEVVSTLKPNETLTPAMLEERKILEFDYCEMAIPKTDATEEDFQQAVAAAAQAPVDLKPFENRFSYAFPAPESREGAPKYESSGDTRRLPADNSTHLVYLEVGSAPQADVKSNSYSKTSGSTFGGNSYTYGSVSTYSSGGDKMKTMIVGRVLGYETLGGIAELVLPQTRVGERIILEATDRKAMALQAGDRIILKCTGQTDVVSAVRDQETLTAAKLQQRRFGELDLCEVASPVISATPELFRALGGKLLQNRS